MNLENQIILGDSFEIFKQIPDKSIDLIMTDIPYLYSDKMPSKNSSFCSKVMPTRIDLQKSDIDNGVDISWLDNACRVMKTINIYIWMSKMQIPEYLDYFVKKDCSFEILVWIKPNAMPLYSNKYCSDKEYCLYFRKGGYCQPKNKHAAATYFLRDINVADKKDIGHPTCKPLDITKTMIENSTHEGDIVLDPFAGSGTTAIACHWLKRKYIAIEKNKDFYNMAVKRLADEQKILELF